MANSLVGGSVVWDLDVKSSRFDAGIDRARAKALSLGSDVNRVDFSGIAQRASASFNGIADSIANAAMKLTLFAVGAGGVGAVLLKSAADLEKTNTSFQVLIGNTEVANKLFGEIKAFADKTPFQFPELASATRLLLGYGVSAEKSFSLLKRLGDTAGATGGDINGITLAFSQMIGRGKVTGDNLRQLTENFVNLRPELAKVAGVEMKDFDKAMESGAISSDMLVKALEIATDKGGKFFGGTDKLALTFSGRMSTLKDTVLEFGRNLLGVKVDPKLGFVVEKGGIFDQISQALPKIITRLKELTPAIKGGFDFLVKNGDTIIAIVAAIASAFVGFKVLAILAPMVGFIASLVTAVSAGAPLIATAVALLGGPFIVIGVLIVGLIAGLTFLQVRFNIFGRALGFLKGVLETVKVGFIAFGQIIVTAIGNLVAGAQSAWSKFTAGLMAVGAIVAGVILTIAAPYLWLYNSIIEPILLLIQAIFLRIFNEVNVFVTTKLNELKMIIATAFLFIKDTVINPVLNTIKGIVTAVWSAIAGVTSSIWNAIKDAIAGPMQTAQGTVSSIANNISGFIKGVWNGIVGFLNGIAGSIVSAITKPFEDAKRKVEEIGRAIKAAAQNINPFHRSSPSLVDNVTKGLAIIRDEYNSLKSISLPPIAHSIAAPNFDMGVGAGYPVKTEYEGAGGGAGINISVAEMNVRDDTDIDKIGRDIGFRIGINPGIFNK